MILADSFVSNQVVTNKRIAVFLLCVFSFLVTSCSTQEERKETVIQGLTMGTSFSVKVINADAKVKNLEQGTTELLNEINGTMSTYLVDSELSKINQNKNSVWISVSTELMTVLQLATDVSEMSGGAFDATVGPVVNLWGFGPSKGQLKEPDVGLISALMAHVGYKKLILDVEASRIKKLDPALYIDLSGIAKGYAVDKVAEFLSEQGVNNYLVEIGGEIRVKGRNKDNLLWHLAIEKPVAGERNVQQVIELTNEAIATSGDYRNYFETDDGKRFSHTISPVTGYPITNRVASVSVITSSAAYSDAMATALMVLGAKDGVTLAERLKLKVIFLVKRDKGFEEVVSSAFASVKR
jgi:thiamine biosynthesis lipoprotein